MKKISTSALTKLLNTDGKDFIQKLEENGYIEITNKSLFSSDKIKVLTSKGKENGGELKTGTKFGDYIIWPENFNPFNSSNIEYISVSTLAEGFGYGARKMNQIISELGWIEPNIKGWKLTKFGEKIGGKELVINKTGATYTKWPIEIKENSSLLNSLGEKNTNSNTSEIIEKKINNSKELNFREKFPAQYRTKDGHNVRSRGELVIDNSLYEYGLAHSYERKLPIEEDVYSDFYIPAKDGGKAVYIEYWGLENQEKYENRKKIKKEIYKKYHMNLVEIENKHIDNLDDHLPRLLLQFGIRVD